MSNSITERLPFDNSLVSFDESVPYETRKALEGKPIEWSDVLPSNFLSAEELTNYIKSKGEPIVTLKDIKIQIIEGGEFGEDDRPKPVLYFYESYMPPLPINKTRRAIFNDTIEVSHPEHAKYQDVMACWVSLIDKIVLYVGDASKDPRVTSRIKKPSDKRQVLFMLHQEGTGKKRRRKTNKRSKPAPEQATTIEDDNEDLGFLDRY